MASQAPLAKLLCDSLKTVHNQGALLYNKGEHTEAFRLYQGALYVTLNLLNARPDLKIIVADGLQEVENTLGNTQLKAYRLHEVIDQIRGVLKLLFDDDIPTLSHPTSRLDKPENLGKD